MEKEPILEIEDEINQINSIINKLDVIRDDEWQKKKMKLKKNLIID